MIYRIKTTLPYWKKLGNTFAIPCSMDFVWNSGKLSNAGKIEFSSCSWERGWNIKFKKSGKTLCTIYPRETYFTAMLVVGKKEKEPFEAMLSECSKELGEIYRQTKEGNGQKWLMLDLQDKGGLYRDALRLAALRAAK